MGNKMFCFQCEQTAGCTGCKGNAGVCGKTADVAQLQDELTGALIGLARATDNAPDVNDGTWRLMIEGLFTTVTNVSFNEKTLRELIDRVHAEKARLVPDCSDCAAPCGRAADYDMARLWNAQEDIRSLKSLILFGVRGMAAYAHHALVLGYTDDAVNDFFAKALFAVGEDWGMEELLPIVMEVGKVNLACMELLDRANTETFGTPEPTAVSLTVEKGPFIVVTGHDLLDLKLLLEQTAGTGVNVYTHGEMLPAHAYPLLHAFPHLAGHYGTAWQNQQKELPAFPGAVLFTTNCIQDPKDYADKVFTSGNVSWPGLVHCKGRDFSAVIRKALELPGFAEDVPGKEVLTGFGRETLLGAAPAVLDAVAQGKLRHIFLVGGCDGARPGRNYYTELVEKIPADCLILTLACGKFRFFDKELGSLGDIPRLLDVGQCNDAYAAVRVALALADALKCGVNDLPLSLVLSWYEQKAVSILLTLLALGVKNIRLGPTLPAFVSPNILKVLVEQWNIMPVTTPDEDLKAILG